VIRGRVLGIVAAAAVAGCAGSETHSPNPGSGGTANGGSGGSMTAGAAGTAAAGTSGSAGTGGAVTTGGGGGGGAGTAGNAGNGGTSGGAAGAAGAGGRGGTTGTAGAGAGGAAGQGGRGGGGGRGGSGAGGATAGTTGTGGGAGGSSAACAYKLCEDFETGTAGAIPTGWTALNGYGADSMRGIGLATDQFHSGAMALKSSSMTPGEQRVQRSLSALGATATKHWGRIFYKVISPSPKPASGQVIHVTLAALQGTTENRIVDTVEQSNGTHQWLFNIPDDSCCTGSSYNWSFDANWHCAEWYIDVSAQAYRFFTDSMEVTQIGFTGKAAAKMSNYTSLAVGAIFYQMPPSPFTIWFDDLAINDTQIGCQ
jgi:hypothetical protein